MEIYANQFVTRQDLETAIKRATKKRSIIVGTKDEHARFHLSEHTFLYGIPCKVTDASSKKSKIPDKPDRGPRVA